MTVNMKLARALRPGHPRIALDKRLLSVARGMLPEAGLMHFELQFGRSAVTLRLLIISLLVHD
jgi:hypothetical protein